MSELEVWFLGFLGRGGLEGWIGVFLLDGFLLDGW